MKPGNIAMISLNGYLDYSRLGTAKCEARRRRVEDCRGIKCNLFVCVTGHYSTGAYVPLVNITGIWPLQNLYPPTANQWAGTDPKPIEGWTITNSLPQPGFVWARPASGRSGHCGIVAHDGRIISGSEFNVNRRESEINKTLRKM